MESFSYNSRIDQWPVNAYCWRTETELEASIVISHGLAEHALRYDRFALQLNSAGYDVWAMDHRAHGTTSGPNGLGDFGDGGWDALVDDIDQLIDKVNSETSKPVILFAHSMGAAAAQQFVQRGSHKISALILSGSAARKPNAEIKPYNDAFEPKRTEYDWLSRDEAEVDKYIADPLCGFEGQELRNGFDRTDTRRVDPELIKNIRNDLPVLLVAGDMDPVNNKLQNLFYLEALWGAAGIRDIDRQYYPEGRHEMLNETNRDEVTKGILRWANSQIR